MLDWSGYSTVAGKFEHKAQWQDTGDLNHSIILSLAEAQTRLDNNGGKLSDIAMLRIASYECQKYWRQVKRNARILSLNSSIADDDSLELADTIADDKAIDLELWLDARVWLLGCPKRLIAVAGKRVKGIPLDNADKLYLGKWRKKEQQRLIN